MNRQSLDRVIPGIRAAELEAHFRTSGWHVIELKYGRRLRAARAQEGGEILLRQIDEMPNEQYQSLFGAGEEARPAEPSSTAWAAPIASGSSSCSTEHRDGAATLVRDLGGHDLGDILDALRLARKTTDRPTVIFAYTIKGYGLEMAGRPQNHSALLTEAQINAFRERSGLTRPRPNGIGSPRGRASSG